MNHRPILYLYGPPGSGKTTVGRQLAANLELPFFDLDEVIVSASRKTIAAIFETEGEAGFRQRELSALQTILARLENSAPKQAVVALGGGALTALEMRQQVESTGRVILLSAPYPLLLARLQAEYRAPNRAPNKAHSALRPLLAGDLPEQLATLLANRSEHYASFTDVLETGNLSAQQAAWQAQVHLGWFRLKAMGHAYDVRVQENGLSDLGSALLTRSLHGPIALVSDEHVAALYGEAVIQQLSSAGYIINLQTLPPGETHKTIRTVQELWSGFLAAGVERGSTVVALGGGVVGDLAGFAAATFLRGVRWVNLPTSLLAMVDASLGGKTGADLPQGKNLIGAFHPPALVLADPQTLVSLPQAEMRSGMAEVIKHGVIADPGLFELAAQPIPDLAQLVRRAIAVKVRIIEADPYERGQRAALNLGHTVGHAIEQASGYRLRHGEAVAIGMVAEARLAEHLSIAQSGLAEKIAAVLAKVGLPTEIPATINRSALLQAMQLDKKKSAGKLRFTLPREIGAVEIGVEVEGSEWLEAL